MVSQLSIFALYLLSSIAYGAAASQPCSGSSGTAAQTRPISSNNNVVVPSSSGASISRTRSTVYSSPSAYQTASSGACSKGSRTPSASSVSRSQKPSASSVSRSRPSGTVQSASSASGSVSGPIRSSSQLPSASSTASNVIQISGCPPITLTTATVSTTTTLPVRSTSTLTYRSTSVTAVSYTTVSTIANELSLVPGPSTGTVYVTKPVLVEAAAPTTVTQPTAPGFTPVSCQAEYYNPTVTTTYTITPDFDTTATIYVLDPSAGVEFTSTVTEYTSTSASFYTFTSTVTITTTSTTTRSEPTKTIYEACATNNVVPNFPPGANGDYIFAVAPYFYYDNFTNVYNTDYTDVLALDAVDCCSLCQADSTCAGSAWDTYGFGTDYFCRLFIKKGADLQQTCNPALIGQSAFLPTTQIRWYISNSACGRYIFRAD